jgi:RNA polymerase sigma-70 factor (ECF subfamily)
MNEKVIATLRSFYAGHRQQLYSYAVSITRSRESAEDAIHQAFEQLLRRDSLPADSRPYIFRSVRNAALDGLRRDRIRSDPVLLGAGADPSEGAGYAADHCSRDIEEALQEISPDEREAIILKIYGSLTFQEIAAIRGVPLPTVASWYRRGLERMRTAMARETSR